MSEYKMFVNVRNMGLVWDFGPQKENESYRYINLVIGYRKGRVDRGFTDRRVDGMERN